MTLRVVFMGTPDFAVPTLSEIAGQGHEVVACYTRAPAAAGRGMAPRPSPVQGLAERFGIPVLTPKTLRGDEAAGLAAVAGAGRVGDLPVAGQQRDHEVDGRALRTRGARGTARVADRPAGGDGHRPRGNAGGPRPGDSDEPVRSVRRPDADLDLLRWYDDLAYAEALGSGGLLRYFKGDADGRGHCLSFCLWESREAAARASGGTQHARAAGITASMYVSYDLERYELKPGDPGGMPGFRRL